MGEENMHKSIRIRVVDEGMTAIMNVYPEPEEELTYHDLKDALEAENIKFGLDEAAVKSIIDEKRFSKDVVIASGIQAKDGEDGYFEPLFETDVVLKPKILKDGSVDYKSMGEIPVVQENQELVRYHKATNAVNGRNVFGQEILGKKGKELQVLKGKGFHLSEDKMVYTAAFTGKATLKGNVLEISNVLVIKEDVSISTGGVSFSGDVVIKGNILSGAEVRASGNIEVNGCVEAAILVAGKNVVLKNGMQGNGKGRIHAGKDVSGKFFEQVTIEAKGNISANSIMHCDLKSEEAINVAGKFGIIVGGRAEAYRGIEATLIGNMSEVKTVLVVGTSTDLYARMAEIDKKQKETNGDLEKLKTANEKVLEMLQKYPDNDELKEKKMLIMRARISKEAVLKDLQRETKEVTEIIAKTTNPRVSVLKSIYPGVVLTINGVTERIKTENYNVFYQKNGLELEFRPNI